MNKYNNVKFIDCCGECIEHVTRLNYWADDDYPFIYMTFGTRHIPWYKRIWLGIRYVFTGRTNNLYNGAELDIKGVMDLRGFLNEYLRFMEEKHPEYMKRIKEEIIDV